MTISVMTIPVTMRVHMSHRFQSLSFDQLLDQRPDVDLYLARVASGTLAGRLAALNTLIIQPRRSDIATLKTEITAARMDE
jgi:hypothetical protein